MNNSMTRVQECALAVITIAVVAIAIAAPIVALTDGRPSHHARATLRSSLDFEASSKARKFAQLLFSPE